LFHAEGQTETNMTKLLVAPRDFANEPKKSSCAVSVIGRRQKSNAVERTSKLAYLSSSRIRSNL